jgi:Zn-dependent M28 family amino/carboxypeptidase
MVKKVAAIVALIVITSLSIAGCTSSSNSNISTLPARSLTRDPVIAGMIGAMNETNIYHTTYDLQSIPTRLYGTAGNVKAAGYLHDKLSAIPGMKVDYENAPYNNVIGVLQGTDNSASGTIVAGAHYDSRSTDLTCATARAPGATDDACGDAIVLELARVMSQHQFNHTIAFAFWNAEERGELGSSVYTAVAAANSVQIPLYFNYDSSCYDPLNHFILDIKYNSQSAWAEQMMVNDNTLYGINFSLAYNVHTACSSDHASFWSRGYPAVMTHSETHGPQHTSSDTIDNVSTAYALKNGQLGMAVLAQTAAVRGVCAPHVAHTDG